VARHLIVDHDVQGAADGVLGQLRHVERLIHDTLPTEGAVSVQQHRHVLGPRIVAVVELLGARLANNHSVHRLEVRRVGHEGEVHAASAQSGAVV
jgi:hypothetical protein